MGVITACFRERIEDAEGSGECYSSQILGSLGRLELMGSSAQVQGLVPGKSVSIILTRGKPEDEVTIVEELFNVVVGL